MSCRKTAAPWPVHARPTRLATPRERAEQGRICFPRLAHRRPGKPPGPHPGTWEFLAHGNSRLTGFPLRDATDPRADTSPLSAGRLAQSDQPGISHLIGASGISAMEHAHMHCEHPGQNVSTVSQISLKLVSNCFNISQFSLKYVSNVKKVSIETVTKRYLPMFNLRHFAALSNRSQ